ncbi:Wzy polymerase domain-containing protein [Rhodoferax sp.]|uniref:PglL family O-oligosaccharyltransferase n=1 Tax=Rhodoferax sp. TaxID=50421 RepID=UPI0025FD2BE1|nr:Wzy polymerase domain-containing protein [Rhodoferax sp.]
MGLFQYFGVPAALAPLFNTTGLGEAYGNLRQRNQFATLTNMGMAALLWWIVRAPMRPAIQRDSILRRWLLATSVVCAATLLAVGNAASSSRTGLLQLAMLVLLRWIWTRFGTGWRQSGVGRILLIVLVAYGVAAVALPLLVGLDLKSTGILARLHDGDPACASRLTLWGNVLHLIAQRPWLGWGWGELDYAHFITLYPGARFCDILDNAHNLPLHLAVELGIPAAFAVCALGLWLAWRARPWREADAGRQMAWTVLALILLHSMLEYPLWYGPFQMAAGLCIFLLWTSRAARSASAAPAAVASRQRNRPLASVFIRNFAIVLIAFVGYAAWDYHRISQIYLAPEQRAAAYRDNTLEKMGDSWLFRDQVRFAQLTITSLSAENALQVNALAKHLLHFSPEPRVIEKLIESAVLLGRDDEALFYLQRYRAAFPERHARWAAMQRHSRCLGGPAPLDCILDGR